MSKGETFRALHSGAPFVIPNPHDAGTARVLETLGFAALATTSSGFAFTLGRLDSSVTLEEVCDHVSSLDRAVGIPVSVDLENGFGASPEDAAAAVVLAAQAGAAGGSIEDWDPAEERIYDAGQAAERIAAAVEAAPPDFVLTARAENLIRGVDDLDDTIARLQAYEAAGAEVLYAPGLRTADDVRAVCSSVGRPVNVLAHRGLTLADVVAAGAQRISVGGALTWAGAAAFVDAAQRLRDGDFGGLRGGGPVAGWLGAG